MTFDLNDLCQQGDVTPRTVRYYIQQGLLPSPGLGAGARYGLGHLARLRLIRRLQREHLPLAEIRRRLEGLDDEAVQALLETPPPGGAAPTASAVDYVRAVLGGPARGTPEVQGWRSPPLFSATPEPAAAPSPGSGRLARPAAADRAQWERIALTPDIEVHVRRPLSREDNRRLEKLLEEARALFRGEEV
jgi:DNA-binding transcriptional MerR regulator